MRQEDIERLRAAVAQAMRRAQTQPSAPVPKLPPVANLRLSQRAANRPTKTSVAPPVRSPSNLDPEIMPAPPEGSRRLGPILIQSSLMVGFVAMVAYGITMFSSFQPDSRAPKSSNGGASIGRMPTASAAAKQEIDSGTASDAAKQEIEFGNCKRRCQTRDQFGTCKRRCQTRDRTRELRATLPNKRSNSGPASDAAKQEIELGTCKRRRQTGEQFGTCKRRRQTGERFGTCKRRRQTGEQFGTCKRRRQTGEQFGTCEHRCQTGEQFGTCKRRRQTGEQFGTCKRRCQTGEQFGTCKRRRQTGERSGTCKRRRQTGERSGTCKRRRQTGEQFGTCKRRRQTGEQFGNCGRCCRETDRTARSCGSNGARSRFTEKRRHCVCPAGLPASS